MFKKRILSSLLIIVLMLTFSSVTSVFAASDITWEVISNDQIKTNVTNNLNLVTKLEDDTVVNWTSSKPHCVDADGVVTRWENDEAVTLTATYGDETKTFNITVSSYKNGKTVWTDDELSGKTIAYQSTDWDGKNSSLSNDYAALSPMLWKYDKDNDKLYTETAYGKWDWDYGLTINGKEYTWGSRAALAGDASLKKVTFTYKDQEYTFCYIDDATRVDKSGNPYRMGFCVQGNNVTAESLYGCGWTSLYVNVDAETGELTVDTSKTLDVALTGCMKQNFEPVTLEARRRVHMSFNMSSYRFPFNSATYNLNEGYERYSFRYRQQRVGSSEKNTQCYFTFFYNNKHFGINAEYGPGYVNTAPYYDGKVRAYYTDGFTSNEQFDIGNVGDATKDSMLGSATEPLSVKTSTEGLTEVPQLVRGTFTDWREIVMETDFENKYTVMYIDGKPVYWKGTVSGTTYYSPFIVHTGSETSKDVARTGFSCPANEKLFMDFEVENVKHELISPSEITAASADPEVKSVTNNDAVINFSRTGKYTVIFAEYGEGDILSNISMKSVVVNETGDNTVTASVSPDVAWDKIFIWSASGTLIPIRATVNIADLAE